MGCTVMIVDDDNFFLKLLRDILTKEGFNIVAEATDGSEAVEKYQAHLPEITIMDIFMPEKSGLDATREILSLDKNAKVLVCSGTGFDEDVEYAMQLGAKDVIYKPFMPEEIMASIRKALGSEAT